MAGDVFSTLPLRSDQLDLFIGHTEEIERLRDGVYSGENCAVVGEPGSGKSSLLERLRSEIEGQLETVAIGVPLADGAYFLRELLQQLLVSLNRKLLKRVNIRSISQDLQRGGETLSKNKLKTLVVPLIEKYPKPLAIFVDDLEKIHSDVGQHLSRSNATLVLLEEMKDVFELSNAAFVLSLQSEFYGHLERMMVGSGETTLLGMIKNVVQVHSFGVEECSELVQRRVSFESRQRGIDEVFSPPALKFAISRCEGNPRKLLFFLSEALYAAHRRGSDKVGYDDLFDCLNRFYKLDEVNRKILFFLAGHEGIVHDDELLSKSLPIDSKSIARRLETLHGKGFVDGCFDKKALKKLYYLKGLMPSRDGRQEKRIAAGGKGKREGPTRYEID